MDIDAYLANKLTDVWNDLEDIEKVMVGDDEYEPLSKNVNDAKLKVNYIIKEVLKLKLLEEVD